MIGPQSRRPTLGHEDGEFWKSCLQATINRKHSPIKRISKKLTDSVSEEFDHLEIILIDVL